MTKNHTKGRSTGELSISIVEKVTISNLQSPVLSLKSPVSSPQPTILKSQIANPHSFYRLPSADYLPSRCAGLRRFALCLPHDQFAVHRHFMVSGGIIINNQRKKLAKLPKFSDFCTVY